MERRMRAVVAGVVAALAVVVGAGPAAGGLTAGGPGETLGPGSATGWVVENPRADGLFDTNEGSATIVNVTTGVDVSCPVLGGWGRARSGTLRPQDLFGETGVTTYGYEGGRCTGAVPVLGIVSSPGTVFAPETYDVGADRIGGSAYPWLWALGLDAPDCVIDMYAEDANAPAPLTYDNRTGTLDLGPVVVTVTRADGAGCAGLAQVGDEMSFETTVVATPAFAVRPL